MKLSITVDLDTESSNEMTFSVEISEMPIISVKALDTLKNKVVDEYLSTLEMMSDKKMTDEQSDSIRNNLLNS